MELILKGQFGKMVANHPPDLVPVPLGEVVGKTKTVPLDNDLLLPEETNRYIFRILAFKHLLENAPAPNP